MNLADTRAHIIEWYLRLGLAQHGLVEDKLAWLADHWFMIADAEFARQAQRAHQRLVSPGAVIEWRPRSWAVARVTVVIAAAPHDLLALVPAVVGRGWKPSKHPCALVVLDDWNPVWWSQWAVTTVAGRLNVCASPSVAARAHDNVVLDARETGAARVRAALDDIGQQTRVVVVRDRNDTPLDGIDAVVCACACQQAPESRLHTISRYRARVFYARRPARPTAIAFSPWAGADHDSGRATRVASAVEVVDSADNNNNDRGHGGADRDDDRNNASARDGLTLGHHHGRRLYEGVPRPTAAFIPMRDCASLDCGCCLSFVPVRVETRERCPFVGGCISCD
nr:hypothetical protein [Pandoravirus massiliensis]